MKWRRRSHRCSACKDQVLVRGSWRKLNKQIIECRSQLSNVCPSVLLRSIHAKIQALNSTLFHHLEQPKKHKLQNLTNPRKKKDSTSRKPKPSHRSHNSRKPTTFKR